MKILAIVIAMSAVLAVPVVAMSQCRNCIPTSRPATLFVPQVTYVAVPGQVETYRKLYRTPLRNLFFGRYRRVFVPQSTAVPLPPASVIPSSN